MKFFEKVKNVALTDVNPYLAGILIVMWVVVCLWLQT